MAYRVLGAGAVFGTGLFGYRQYRKSAVQAEKAADPTKMNAEEKFNLFASAGGEMMTTEDFVNSMVAGHSCDRKISKAEATYKSLSEVFKKMDANQDGVLNYSEYCMFLTLVSTSKEHFRMAFKMFDMNGNEKIDLEDFKKMMSALVIDPTVNLSYKGGVCEQFFGRDYKKEITVDAFTKLVDELRREVRTAEFKSVQESGSTIPFHKLQGLFGIDGGDAAGGSNLSCSLSQYHNLVSVLLQADTIQRSMEIYTGGRDEGNRGVDKKQFVRALRAADAKLNKEEVDLFFDLFDSDRSGSIDHTEFALVSKKKRAFFAPHQPRYDQPQRNAIQKFAYCMQQRE